MASVVAQSNGDGYSPNMVLPRPQIGIERLQARRASNEPKEAMNCKSCRKRKVRIAVGKPKSCRRSLTPGVRSSATGSSRPARRVRLSTAPVFMVGHMSCFMANCFLRKRLLTGYSRCYAEETRSQDRRVGSIAQAGKRAGETTKRREQARHR